MHGSRTAPWRRLSRARTRAVLWPLACWCLAATTSSCKSRAGEAHDAPPPPPSPMFDAASTFDRATFCDQVFPRAEVQARTGLALTRVAPRVTTAGRIACTYRTDADETADAPVRISLRVDCTRDGTVRSPREVVAAMAGADGEVSDVPLGRDGARVTLPRFRSRFLATRHPSLPCTLTVDAENTSRDDTSALMSLALDRLTSANRPR